MKRSVLLFLLLFFLLSTAGFADKESYYLSFYCNSYFLYPGEKIPVNVSLYYYNLKNLKKTGDLTENINFKIYKIPSDLTADKYKDYTVQNAPVKEISKTVTINNNNNNYWEGYLNTELPELTSGIYYIVGSTPKTSYKATIRVSKIGMSAKMSTESIIFFVQDRKTGQPIDKAEVNLFLPQEVKKFKTDKEGLINIHIQELGDIKDSDRLRAVVHKGEDTGAINLSIRVEEEIFKGYIYTDRPVYRPSQKVIFKGILRVQKKNNLDFASNEDINIIIKDAKNTEIYKKTLKTDSYGAVSGDFTLSEEPPLGTYYIICTNSKNQKATGTFQVQEYRKPEFEITIKPEKEQYVQGDKMTFNMEAKYYFGAPVPEREYTYQIYREYYYPYCCYCWWDEELMPHPSSGMELVGSGKGKTDKYGHAFFSCKASKVNYDANYNIMVRMTDESRREVTGFTNTLITRGAFYMTLTSDKYLYKPGEQVHIKIEAKDYSGKPVETAVTSKVKYEYYDKQSKKWLWQNIKNIEFKTDKNGIGSYDFITDKDGYYELECTSEDQNKNKIRATGYVYSYSDGGYYNWYRLTNLEIIPDKKIYEPGEQANFFIVCPFEGVKALVTVEGEKIFTQKVVDFANRTASFKVNITKNHTPNFYIGISFYYNGQFYYQNKQIICPSKDKFLTISIEADKEKYRPRDTAKFILKTTDKDNRPVTSQVTMGVADESVYAVVSDSTRNIQKFFYDFKKNLTCTYSSDGYVFRRNYFDNDLFSEEDIDILPQAELKSLAPSTADSMKPRGVDLPDRGGVNLHDQKPLVQPKFIRSFFPDTAYFNPNIITNERGYAEVIFSMPDTLTTWRATARSVTTDTKVGENNKKIIVTKDLLARLITPRFFTQRDETLITGIVHNYLNTKKTVQVKLEIDGGIELVDKAECKVEVPPNGSTPIDWKIKVKSSGDCKINLTALTDEESDAVELTVPVLPHGTEKFVALGGSTKDRAEEEFTLPEETEEGSAKCLIMLEPSIASSILSSLEYLIGYPYGCVEQTMSRFLPNVIVSKTLGELDIYDPNMNKELPKMVQDGFSRLYSLHHFDGGWGWWKNDESHPYMTSYVVYGLALAKEANYAVDENKLKDGIHWLKWHYSSEKDINTKTYMAFAVTTAGGNCKDWLMSLYNKRQELNSYSQAVLALSLKKAGYNKEALEIVKLLEKTADISGTTACWSGLTGSYGWTDNKVETTSYCLSALLAINPQSEIIPKVVRYLSFNRKGNYWYSTKDTAAAVMALTGYIKITKEMNPDFETDFYFNGTKLNTLKFTKDDVGKPGKKIEIPFDQGLLAGKNKVKFDIRGKGMLYYTIYLKYYTSEENVKAWDSGFKVKRTYYLLKENTKDPEKAKVKLENEAEVKSQDTILVELEVTGSANYEYLIIEDPKPAGCEYESLEVKQNYTLWNYWYAHKELRDEKCAYFATSYLPGTQKITYKMRAETPGTFHVMPTRAYLMYSPEVGGNSDELILKIRENKKEKTGLTPVPVTEKTIETPVAQTTPGTEEKKTPPSRTVLLVSITGVSVVIILTVLKAFKV